MMRRFFLFLILLLNLSPVYSQLPSISYGSMVRHAGFPSKWVAPRNVDVWLPPGYEKETGYAVLYMHDGQMLFDSSITWNRQEWGMDEVAGSLITQKKIKPFIIVAVSNGGAARHREYLPEKPFRILSPENQKQILLSERPGGTRLFDRDEIHSDLYLRFLTEELKPFIDKEYKVSSKRENTFIMGSSMGGLISLYAVCEYPGIFGGAACLSTHWPGIFVSVDNPYPSSLFSYLSQKLPDTARHKFYLDRGNLTLDSLYEPYQKSADEIFRRKGFTDNNFVSMIFEGDAHDENAWRRRIHIPLLFLMGN